MGKGVLLGGEIFNDLLIIMVICVILVVREGVLVSFFLVFLVGEILFFCLWIILIYLLLFKGVGLMLGVVGVDIVFFRGLILVVILNFFIIILYG